MTYNHTIWWYSLAGQEVHQWFRCLGCSESPPPDGTNTKFEYSLKIINPSRMSEFKDVDLRGQHYIVNRSTNSRTSHPVFQLALVMSRIWKLLTWGSLSLDMERRVEKCGSLTMMCRKCTAHTVGRREFFCGVTLIACRGLHKPLLPQARASLQQNEVQEVPQRVDLAMTHKYEGRRKWTRFFCG